MEKPIHIVTESLSEGDVVSRPTPTAFTTKEEAEKEYKKLLSTFEQKHKNEIRCGIWKLANDTLSDSHVRYYHVNAEDSYELFLDTTILNG